MVILIFDERILRNLVGHGSAPPQDMEILDLLQQVRSWA